MVESPRNASPGGYTSPHIIEASLLRGEISSPSRSRASDVLTSSDASSSSAASYVSPYVMEGSSSGAIFKPVGGAVFVHVCSPLHI